MESDIAAAASMSIKSSLFRGAEKCQIPVTEGPTGRGVTPNGLIFALLLFIYVILDTFAQKLGHLKKSFFTLKKSTYSPLTTQKVEKSSIPNFTFFE